MIRGVRDPIFAAIFAAATMLLATKNGVGLSPDSAAYWRIARTFAGQPPMRVDGFDPPVAINHYPPALPTMLAPFVAAGVTPMAAGRTLAVIFAALNAVLLTSIATRRAGDTKPIILAAAIAFPFTFCGPMLWSEGPFFACVLVAIIAMAKTSEASAGPRFDVQTGERKWRGTPWLALAAGAIVAATLTRYVGVFLVPLLVVDVVAKKIIWRRLPLALACLVPVVAWAILAGERGGVGGREWVPHFAAPDGWQVIVAFIALALFAASIRVARRATSPALPRLAALAAAVYVAALLLSKSFLDQHTPIDARLLSPLAVLFLLVVAATPWREMGVGVAIVLAVASALLCARGVADLRQSIKGRDYAAPEWRESPTLQAARSLPNEAIVFTNAPDVLVLLAGRDAMLLPRKLDPASGRANEVYESQMARLASLLHDGHASIVWFDRLGKRSYLPTEAQMREIMDGREIREARDGWVRR